RFDIDVIGGNIATAEAVFDLADAGVDGVRFKRPVVPGDRLTLEARIDSVKRTIWRFKCRASVDGELACEATILCALKAD
ncbi:hypothetical protein LCGC14_3037180, partial [marine sediment metagenome]